MRRSLMVLGVVTLSLILPGMDRSDRAAASTFDCWLFWWAYNREEILPDPGIRPEVEAAARESIAPALRRARAETYGEGEGTGSDE